MRRIGLKPGNHGSYFQNVPAVTITTDTAKSNFAIATQQGPLAPKYGDDAIYWTPQFKSADVTVENAPLVFAGCGIVAPEYNWNDYAAST